ncbi:Altered inheritance of mitochondria protein 9, mitochondrial [Madurella mycetomatis]|uniref:Altered inheritance of mitochondria protein 9, mitochondrial n=1 Tax=Madurella mycetomatis TaxID=100816 RepID=A0A175WHH6_9PEZI|nr:Altered inheritance of mitochondria protein 9, mitochondrial [Madurella mycetomatis]
MPRVLRSIGLLCYECMRAGYEDPDADPCSGHVTVRFLGEGTWNRAFAVSTCHGGRYRALIFRVALPAITHLSKVEAEAATMEWVRCNTDIPVPEVLDYESSPRNPVGYPWMLMTRMPGVPFANAVLTTQQKVGIAEIVAHWMNTLSQHEFEGIGTPKNGPDGVTPSALGPAVDVDLLTREWHDGLPRPVAPFPDLHSYASAFISKESCPRLQALIDRIIWPLSRNIPIPTPAGSILATLRSVVNRFTLQHWDINPGNLLVDPETGLPTGLIDWEHIHTLPVALGLRYPSIMTVGDDSFDESIDYECCIEDSEAMRRAFDQKLHELRSPWLAASKGGLHDLELVRQWDYRDPLLLVRLLMMFLRLEDYSEATIQWFEDRVADGLLPW